LYEMLSQFTLILYALLYEILYEILYAILYQILYVDGLNFAWETYLPAPVAFAFAIIFLLGVIPLAVNITGIPSARALRCAQKCILLRDITRQLPTLLT
jgi:hypothetical protein